MWMGCLKVYWRNLLTVDDELISILEYLLSALTGVVASMT
jgi:hypothetical protein